MSATTTPEERLQAAEKREAIAWDNLANAARLFAGAEHLAEALRAAAKRWTNAHHQTSRCRKHLAEAEIDGTA